MSKNDSLKKAKVVKNDEFYTKISDIEKEMKHYGKHFKDAVIFCNCDDPEQSNFWKYFSLNFEKLGLKKLIATHFDYEKPTYKLEMLGKEDIVRTNLSENGDFRSPECIALLKEADIVVTNPPFSLFREYVDQLFEYGKKFIILGNMNAVTYKNVFPKIANGQMWLGRSAKGRSMEFILPENHNGEIKISRIDEQGNKYTSMGNVRWFTNLDFTERHEDILLYETYIPEKYNRYDNYNAINVDKIKDIPVDYDGIIGVPITFLEKHNPEQFEILGIAKTPLCHDNKEEARRCREYTSVKQYLENKEIGSGVKINDAAAIAQKEKPQKGTYYIEEGRPVFITTTYVRILIRHKQKEGPWEQSGEKKDNRQTLDNSFLLE